MCTPCVGNRVVLLTVAVCEQDPLDQLLGVDDDSAAQRPAPTVVKVGPQPRASRRRRQPAARPSPEEEELLEELQQVDEVLPQTTRRGRSRRQAARELRREHENLGFDEDEAMAMALAASLVDAPMGDQFPTAAEAGETELVVPANTGTRRARAARQQRTNAAGTSRAADAGSASARRATSRKRIVHVDPITGQRIRAPRFPRPSLTTANAAEAVDVHAYMADVQESPEADETGGESDEEEQPSAEAVAAENERRAREQMLAERLGRSLAAPVAAPSPLKPFAQRRPITGSPDLSCSSPPQPTMDDTSAASGVSASPSSNCGSYDESPGTSALDTSTGDLMSRLQKRLRAGKASTTARKSSTPLQEREQNRRDSVQLADDM